MYMPQPRLDSLSCCINVKVSWLTLQIPLECTVAGANTVLAFKKAE